MTTTTDVAGQLAVIQDLARHYDGHDFLNVEGVEHFTKPFGFVGTTYVHHASPGNMKGLTFNDGADQCEGQGVAEMVEEICRHLGVSFVPKMGRGSRYRSALGSLIAHLEAKQ